MPKLPVLGSKSVRQRVIEELRREPEQSNVQLARRIDARPDAVSSVTVTAWKQGILERARDPEHVDPRPYRPWKYWIKR